MSIAVTRLHTYQGHRDSVYTLTAGPLPHVFFSAGGDGLVVRWNMKHPDEGDLLAQLPHSVYALSYWPDKQYLIAGHNTEGIHVIDTVHRKEVASLKLGSASIFDIRVINGQAWIAAGDGCVTVVNLSSMTVLHKMEVSSKSARTIAIHPFNGTVAVGYSDHAIRVFDSRSFEQLAGWTGHSNSVFTLAYTRDGHFLLSAGRDAHLKAWDVQGNYGQHGDVVAHLFAINNLDFSPDGKHFVTCSLDKSIKIWRTADLTLLKVIDKARHAGHGTSVNRVLWTTYKDQVLSASDDRTISSWDVIF
ncbi:MAG TPA: WD40 repeat domain-containing protein [Cyclobacteriaceae bacterium]|nr:WD40 repeat domain-containing protein [Cyclobacteriaceae bacterium]